MNQKRLQDIGVAIVGTGFMGWVHVEALRRVGVHVVGILGSTPEKSQVAAEEWGMEKAYSNYDELIGDSDVSSVHIGTPNRHHFEQAKLALQAGKHVMCEKPLAMTSRESQELVRIAGENPALAAGVNYNIRFYPLCVEAKQRIGSKPFGDVFHVTGSYVQDWLLKATDYNWRVLVDEVGPLRAIADIGTHWLDLVQSITGLRIVSVCADLNTVHSQRQRPRGEVQTFQSDANVSGDFVSIDISTEDYGSVLFRFENGANGCLTVSQVTAGRKNCLRLEVAGAQQSLAWNSESPNELWIGHRDRANEKLIRDPAILSAAASEASTYPGGHNEGYADSFKQCFRSFYGHILQPVASTLRPFPTFADGHREILLCDAILQSHIQQKWITLAE